MLAETSSAVAYTVAMPDFVPAVIRPVEEIVATSAGEIVQPTVGPEMMLSCQPVSTPVAWVCSPVASDESVVLIVMSRTPYLPARRVSGVWSDLVGSQAVAARRASPTSAGGRRRNDVRVGFMKRGNLEACGEVTAHAHPRSRDRERGGDVRCRGSCWGTVGERAGKRDRVM